MPFRDVPAGAYYAQPVLWAYHAGVVNGCGADTFCPTQAISRQDLTVILYRYACLAGIADAAQSENVLSGFADAGTVSDYARAALLWRFVRQYSLAEHRAVPCVLHPPIPVPAGPPRSQRLRGGCCLFYPARNSRRYSRGPQ